MESGEEKQRSIPDRIQNLGGGRPNGSRCLSSSIEDRACLLPYCSSRAGVGLGDNQMKQNNNAQAGDER